MKNTIKLLILSCCLLFATATFAQSKIGYVNSAELLSSLPQWKSAESSLQTFSTDLENQLQAMVAKITDEFDAFDARNKAGEVPPRELEEKKIYFQNQEKAIQNFELDAQKKVAQKRDALVQPILTKVENAIQQVATENGYNYILDNSVGILLHVSASDDVTTLVKAKL